MLSQDLFGISEDLTRVYASYDAIELLIGASKGVSLDGSNLASLIGLVNQELKTVIDGLQVNPHA